MHTKCRGYLEYKLFSLFFVYLISWGITFEISNHKVVQESLIVGIGENVTLVCGENKEDKVTRWIYYKREKIDETILSTKLNSLTLRNVNYNSSGQYKCLQNNKTIKLVKLKVKGKDDPPILTTCETNGLLTTLNCCWEESPYPNTTYTIYYNISNVKAANSVFDLFTTTQSPSLFNSTLMQHVTCNQPIKSQPVCCSINLPVYNKIGLDVILIGRSKRNESNSVQYKEMPYHWVKPDPPVEVNISNPDVETTYNDVTSLLVTWSRPVANHALPLVYRIGHRLSNSTDTWHVEEIITELSHVITNLLSGSNYDVRVSSMPNPEKHLFQGNWGSWSDVISSKTLSKKPTLRIRFENIKAIIYNQSTLINVQWFPSHLANQDKFYYKIDYVTNDITKTIKIAGHLLSTQFNVNTTDHLIVVNGYACNELGCSPATTETVDLKKALYRINNVTLNVWSSGYNITWNNKNVQNKKCLVQLRTCARQSLHFSSIFSENNYKQKCETTEIKQEIIVDCSTNNFTTNLTTISSCEVYIVNVGRIFQQGIQEIISITTSNYESINPTFPQVGQLTLTTNDVNKSSDVTNYVVKASWDDNSDICDISDYDLNVVYSPTKLCQFASSKCLNSFHKQKVKECKNGSQEISSNVYGATNYYVGLAFCCPSLTSNFCFQASQGFSTIYTNIGAPSMPLQLDWENGNFLKLTWSPPAHPNGPIDGYTIQYGGYNQTDDVIGEVSTKNRYFELPVSCQTTGGGYWVKVSGYNQVGLDVLEGVPAFSSQSQVCAISNNQLRNIFIVLAFCSLVMVTFISLCRYNRQKVKKFVRRHIWSTIPTPQILLEMTSYDAQPEPADDVIQIRSTSMKEIPQSFKIGESQPNARHKNDDVMGTTYDTRNEADEYSPLISQDCQNHQREPGDVVPGTSDPLRDSGLSSFISGPHRPPFLHSPYSFVSQLNDVSADEYASVECAAPSWRSWMYPRSFGFSDATSGQRRSSYSGSSLVPTYVREKENATSSGAPGTSGASRIAPGSFRDLNYARIAGSDNIKGSAENNTENNLFLPGPTSSLQGNNPLRRVESWYDQSHTDSSNIFNQPEQLPNYIGSTDSRVSKFSRQTSVSISEDRKQSVTSCDSIDVFYPGVKNVKNETQSKCEPESYLTLGEAVEMGVVSLPNSAFSYDDNSIFNLPSESDIASNIATIGSLTRDMDEPRDNTDVTATVSNDVIVMNNDVNFNNNNFQSTSSGAAEPNINAFTNNATLPRGNDVTDSDNDVTESLLFNEEPNAEGGGYVTLAEASNI